MKKCFSIIFAFVFFISIASPAFADDIYGLWKSDGKSNMNTILKITDTHFSGLRYKVMENDGVIIKISLTNSKKLTEIEIENPNKIKVTTVNGEKFTYTLVTKNVNLPEKQVRELIKSKKDQDGK